MHFHIFAGFRTHFHKPGHNPERHFSGIFSGAFSTSVSDRIFGDFGMILE